MGSVKKSLKLWKRFAESDSVIKKGAEEIVRRMELAYNRQRARSAKKG